MSTEQEMNVAGFNVQFEPVSDSRDGFDQYGIRRNYEDDGETLESIDVIYNAMEPGVRKGVEIAPEFLQSVADDASEGIPIQYDHSHSQRANVGYLKDVKYSEQSEFLKTMFNIPNTGSQIRSDTIADFTHSTGPQIQDGSVGFNPRTLEFTQPEADGADARFQSAELIEFSLTPFPAGYDNGGISPKFSEVMTDFTEDLPEINAESQLADSQIK